MRTVSRLFALALLLWGLAFHAAMAQDMSLLPKYGSAPKSEALQAADDRFFTEIDRQYNGDRKKAAQDAVMRGWQALRQGNPQEAMRRFNQAWLLDASNGHALWGMGAVQGGAGQMADAMALFQEAEPLLPNDIDFAVDFARTQGMAAAMANDGAALQLALQRFDRLHARAPQHTLNLQNWAIVLFSAGRYAEAWHKVQLAEATPRRADLDARFVAALQAKMPRP